MLYATTAIKRKDGSLDKTWSHRYNQSDLDSTWNSVSDVNKITILYNNGKKYEGVSIISGTVTAICRAVVVAQCNGRY
jgi:hypothetical protein